MNTDTSPILQNKVAIITGAGRGIGKAMALYMAEMGAKVVVNDLGGDADGSGASKIADQVVEEIKQAGGEALANYDSVATMEGGKSLIQSAIDHFGALDILVNNAGILRDRTIFKMTESDWDAVMNVHLKGHFSCCQPFARYIRETQRENCRIINFSSVSGLMGNFGQANYAAAKAGIAGLSRVLSLELNKYKCTVNTISPGAATRMTLPLYEARGMKVDPDSPSAGPQQIAPVVAWLASDKASDFTGQIIHAARGTVSIMQQPAFIRTFQNDALWNQDQLDDVMPQLLDAKLSLDELTKEKAAPEKVGS